MKNNSHGKLTTPEKLLERLQSIERDIGRNEARGNFTESMRFHHKELEQIKQQIVEALKLANELKSTHAFYLKSGNGHCAGVTNQILGLSSYGGKLIEFK